jgi:hypothetical protein
MSLVYRGPDYIGHPLSNPARRAPVFSPTPVTRAVTPITRSETAGDMIVSLHEASHAAYQALTGRSVYSAEIDRDGGGRVRTSVNDVRAPLTGREPPPGKVPTDARTKGEWVSLLIGLACPRYAQRRYCGSNRHDGNCSHDFAVVDRVLSAISSTSAEKSELLTEIENKAERFVNKHWFSILRLSRALCARGYLNESEIRSILTRAPSVVLNKAGADLAYDLVTSGKLNWGGFAFDSDDENDLLDEYHLGVDGDSVHYPFSKTGDEVYVAALQAAMSEGGVVGEYAAQLLDKITKMKKQSLENTTGGRSRSYGRNGDMLWRTDGHLVPFR